ncbi:MAG: FMN-binding protein [Desulfobacter postgatei]|uniref:FMN-binding protein n=1 Tax=Desulfobacter postgatei TaxID=2293 RepID=UPI0023EFAC96|nr:FMN-binding protein [Desulfobacter postgatei]MDD4273104.1 FMN-binding protein [Desulfobacter postgatei]
MSLKNSNLAQAWLVLLLATLFGTALAGIQVKLGPVIEANKVKETMVKIPELVLGQDLAAELAADNQSLTIKSRVIEVKKNETTKYYTVYDAWLPDGKMAGHVVKADGQGYADKIELLLGLDAEGKSITGLFVLDQKETPGLGAKILEDSWRGQFKEKSTAKTLSVVKGGGVKKDEIDAISGATISSRSVTGIVNTTIANIASQLQGTEGSGDGPVNDKTPAVQNEDPGKNKEHS